MHNAQTVSPLTSRRGCDSLTWPMNCGEQRPGILYMATILSFVRAQKCAHKSDQISQSSPKE